MSGKSAQMDLEGPPRMAASIGTLRYDPRVETPEREIFDPWWLILQYDPALLDQWRQTVEELHGIHLSYPRWGAHVTIVAGEIPRHKSKWGLRNGEQIRFTYTPHILTDDTFCWLPAKCDELLDLRATLGLPRNPRRTLHMTLGRVKKSKVEE